MAAKISLVFWGKWGGWGCGVGTASGLNSVGEMASLAAAVAPDAPLGLAAVSGRPASPGGGPNFGDRMVLRGGGVQIAAGVCLGASTVLMVFVGVGRGFGESQSATSTSSPREHPAIAQASSPASTPIGSTLRRIRLTFRFQRDVPLTAPNPPFVDHVLTTLRHFLDQAGFRHLARIPPFRTRGVYPVHDWYVGRRAHQGRPLPLAAHSDPLSFGCPPLYELFVRHGCVSVDLPPVLEDAGFVRSCGDGSWESLYHIAPIVSAAGPLAILSSIPNRSPGEFVYLGDDTGMLIEAASRLSGQGRALDVCCGCGAVGLSLPAQWTSVVGADLNEDALRLAAWNRRLNGVSRPVHYVLSDLYTEVDGTFDLVVGNPPALPDFGASLSERADLRFAAGGSTPTRLTVEAVQGLQSRLRPGGQALLLTFSLGEQLWNDLQGVLSREFSLTYHVRESFRLQQGASLHHVWIHIRRDSRGRWFRRGPTLWERLCRLDRPWSQPGEHPQRERLPKS